jgi:hypothetical protein
MFATFARLAVVVQFHSRSLSSFGMTANKIECDFERGEESFFMRAVASDAG